MVGVLGMVAGAFAFVAAYPALRPMIQGLGDGGELTLPTLTGTSPWLWVGILAGLGGAAWLLARGRDRRARVPEAAPSGGPIREASGAGRVLPGGS